MNSHEKLAASRLLGEMEKTAMLLDGQGGDRQPREFSEDEERRIRRGKMKMLRGPFASSKAPATKRLASPLLRSLLAGGTIGLAGSLYGSLLGGASGGVPGANKGALVGGALAGIPAGLLAYMRNRQENEDIEDALSRLPEGATIRDLEREPLYRDRLMRGAVMFGRGR